MAYSKSVPAPIEQENAFDSFVESQLPGSVRRGLKRLAEAFESAGKKRSYMLLPLSGLLNFGIDENRIVTALEEVVNEPHGEWAQALLDGDPQRVQELARSKGYETPTKEKELFFDR